MNNKIQDRVRNVLSAVFEVPIDKIDEDFSPEIIDSWDSLKHMNVVVALSEEFNVQFTDDDIIELIDTKRIMSVLMGKLPTNNT